MFEFHWSVTDTLHKSVCKGSFGFVPRAGEFLNFGRLDKRYLVLGVIYDMDTPGNVGILVEPVK